MAGEPRSDSAAGVRPDRDLIRAELEATREAFHRLLDRMSENDWNRRSATPEWTLGEVMVHITMYLTTVIPRGVDAPRRGKRWGGFPPFIARTPIVHWLNTIGTRWLARNVHRASIRSTYDAAHADLLGLLNGVRDDEWSRTTYTLGGTMTIEELFRVHARHFAEHAQAIEPVLSGPPSHDPSGGDQGGRAAGR